MRLFTRDSKVEALKRAPLFEGLSRTELNELAKVTEDVDARPGEVLCKEGAIGQEFFVIMEGEAEVLRNGKRTATCGSGEFLGDCARCRRPAHRHGESEVAASVLRDDPAMSSAVARRQLGRRTQGPARLGQTRGLARVR
jgi:CRP-like cAMP-binding protein